jgi:hypothetical protein
MRKLLFRGALERHTIQQEPGPCRSEQESALGRDSGDQLLESNAKLFCDSSMREAVKAGVPQQDV